MHLKSSLGFDLWPLLPLKNVISYVWLKGEMWLLWHNMLIHTVLRGRVQAFDGLLCLQDVIQVCY